VNPWNYYDLHFQTDAWDIESGAPHTKTYHDVEGEYRRAIALGNSERATRCAIELTSLAAAGRVPRVTDSLSESTFGFVHNMSGEPGQWPLLAPHMRLYDSVQRSDPFVWSRNHLLFSQHLDQLHATYTIRPIERDRSDVTRIGNFYPRSGTVLAHLYIGDGRSNNPITSAYDAFYHARSRSPRVIVVSACHSVDDTPFDYDQVDEVPLPLVTQTFSLGASMLAVDALSDSSEYSEHEWDDSATPAYGAPAGYDV
jgi:hypothetical protein